mgnify:FL=1
MSLDRIDHAASAMGRMPGYLRKQRWLELLAAISAEVQEIEDMWLAMLASNAIADATGDQLDQIGRLVTQPRGGAVDADYRRRILAKVAANRSLGLVGDIIRIVRLVVDDAAVTVQVDQQGIAAYVAKLGAAAVPSATATDLAAFLRKGTSAGVRSIVESSTVADADAFALDGPGGLPFVLVPTLPLANLSLPSGMNTVVGMRAEWLDAVGSDPDGHTLELRDAAGEAVTNGIDTVVEFKGGTSTVASVEALINSSARLFVVTPSTVSGVLSAANAFSVTGMQVGGAPGGAFAIAQE